MPNLCHKCFYEYNTPGSCPRCGYDATADLGKYPLALRPGSILGGRYIVGRVLGEGGFGITYSAQDYDSKDLVAIKEHFPSSIVTRTGHTYVSLISDGMKDAFVEGKEKFLSEAQTLSQFNGLENICDIYSYFEENGTAYFAMEYVNGIPLDEFIKKLGRVLSFEEAARLLLPVMDALSHVHEKGIIHRDISPDNIMVSPEGKVMLIDFGAARYSMGEKSRSLDVILKHGFAPREQYARHGRQGAYTDVYAVAATFYYSITGKVPPDAIDRTEADELKSPSSLGIKLPRRAEQALMKALSINYGQRYQSMREFAEALKKELPPSKAELERQKQQRLEEERKKKAELEEKKRLEAEEREKKRLELEEKKRQEAEARRTKQLEKEELKRRKTEEKQSSKARKSKKPLALIAALAAIAIGAGAFFATKEPVETLQPEISTPEPTSIAILAPTPSPVPTAIPFSWELTEDGTLYIRGEGEMDTFATSSSAPWDSDKEEIRSVVIADGISSISNYAFYGCSALESISIPPSVNSIGIQAFYNCSALSSIELPDGINNIGRFAFTGCSALENVRIPSSVTSLTTSVFESCSSLRTVTIPASVLSIDSFAFRYCPNLSRIDYLGTKEQWDKVAYSKNYNKPSANCLYTHSGTVKPNISWTLSNDGTLTISGEGGLNGFGVVQNSTILAANSGGLVYYGSAPWCSIEIRPLVKNLIVSPGVTSVGSNFFWGCYNLQTASFPEGFKSIGQSAFQECTSLMEVSFEEGLKTISKEAFSSCPYLSKIRLPASLETVESDAFLLCNNLRTVEYAGSMAQWNAVYISVSDHAEGNSALKNAEIICSIVAEGSVGENISWVLSNNGTLTIIGSGEMEEYVNNSDFPWFTYRSGIRSIKISEGISSVSKAAFYDCPNLSSVSIPEGITRIGAYAFCTCPSLNNIFIPSSVTSIEYCAFQGCTSLSTVEYAGSQKQWKTINISDGNEPLENAQLQCSFIAEGSAGENAQWILSNDGTLTISGTGALPNVSGTATHNLLYVYSPNVKKITIEEGITSVGSKNFYSLVNLEEVQLPDSVTSIGGSAFWNCYKLRSISMSNSIKQISENAFFDTQLSSVEFRGTRKQWDSIQIGKNNEPLKNANITFLG